MTEGLLSYLMATIIIFISNNLVDSNKNLRLGFTLLGFLVLTKQFISLLSIFLLIYFLFNKKTNKFIIYGMIGPLIKQISSFSHFKNIDKNYHLKQIDLTDTILDLLLFRDLAFENLEIIFNNLYYDKPTFYIFAVFLLSLVLNFKKLGSKPTIYSGIIFLNLIFVLTLYISVWKNMELESPIRYLLNLLHLTLITEFILLEKYK